MLIYLLIILILLSLHLALTWETLGHKWVRGLVYAPLGPRRDDRAPPRRRGGPESQERERYVAAGFGQAHRQLRRGTVPGVNCRHLKPSLHSANIGALCRRSHTDHEESGTMIRALGIAWTLLGVVGVCLCGTECLRLYGMAGAVTTGAMVATTAALVVCASIVVLGCGLIAERRWARMGIMVPGFLVGLYDLSFIALVGLEFGWLCFAAALLTLALVALTTWGVTRHPVSGKRGPGYNGRRVH
jgi:hypothetical protein